jgi:nucleotide-binding universal stress UspA family protein
MFPFRRIVFPVDYSEPCRAVARYVQDMVRHYSAELTLGYAYGPLDALANHELLVTDPDLEAKAAALEQDKLRDFARQMFPGIQVESIVTLGEPGGVIDKLAEQQRADLVMLPTRGQGPVRRFLLGSVTAKVLHDVSTAVWTGAGAALEDHHGRIPYQSIVCALDESSEASAVLKAAASVAATYGAQLWIVHVVPTPPDYPDLDLAEHTKKLTERAEFKLRELKSSLGIDAPHTVVDALLSEGVRHELIRRKADLLVTGRGHSIGTFSRLWSHLYGIIRDAPCPVLSI